MLHRVLLRQRKRHELRLVIGAHLSPNCDPLLFANSDPHSLHQHELSDTCLLGIQLLENLCRVKAVRGQEIIVASVIVDKLILQREGLEIA